MDAPKTPLIVVQRHDLLKHFSKESARVKLAALAILVIGPSLAALAVAYIVRRLL